MLELDDVPGVPVEPVESSTPTDVGTEEDEEDEEGTPLPVDAATPPLESPAPGDVDVGELQLTSPTTRKSGTVLIIATSVLHTRRASPEGVVSARAPWSALHASPYASQEDQARVVLKVTRPQADAVDQLSARGGEIIGGVANDVADRGGSGELE